MRESWDVRVHRSLVGGLLVVRRRRRDSPWLGGAIPPCAIPFHVAKSLGFARRGRLYTRNWEEFSTHLPKGFRFYRGRIIGRITFKITREDV